MIWLLSFVPGFSVVLPNLITKLNAVKEKYLTRSAPASSVVKVTYRKKSNLSLLSLTKMYCNPYLLGGTTLVRKRQQKFITFIKSGTTLVHYLYKMLSLMKVLSSVSPWRVTNLHKKWDSTIILFLQNRLLDSFLLR